MQTDAIIVFFLIFLFFNTKIWNWKFCYHLAHQTTFFYFVVKIAISNDVVKQNKIFSSIFNHSSCKKAILWRLRCFRWFRFEFKFSQSSHGRRRCEIFPFLPYFFKRKFRLTFWHANQALNVIAQLNRLIIFVYKKVRFFHNFFCLFNLSSSSHNFTEENKSYLWLISDDDDNNNSNNVDDVCSWKTDVAVDFETFFLSFQQIYVFFVSWFFPFRASNNVDSKL